MRPSSLVGIDPEDTYLCFEFDSAVVGLGEHVEGMMAEYTPDNKPKYKTVKDALATANRSKKTVKRRVAAGAIKPPNITRKER